MAATIPAQPARAGAVPPQSASQPVPNAPPSVAGDWLLTNYAWYGANKDQQFSFRLNLTQQGSHITGQARDAKGTMTLNINGSLAGRTVHAGYNQADSDITGVFLRTFTADGTGFEGAYTSNAPNVGTSYGRRASGSVTSVDQATVFVVDTSTNSDTVHLGDTAYVCYTVSSLSLITLRSSIIDNQPLDGYKHRDDDGTGFCAGPYPITASGPLTYTLDMEIDGQIVTQSAVTINVSR